VKIFSIAVDVFASRSAIVLISIVGLGMRNTFLFNVAKLLDAKPHFIKISVSKNSSLGGRFGRSLYGLFRSNIKLNTSILYNFNEHEANICSFLIITMPYVYFLLAK
jgi:hypothetical protein